MTTFSTSISVHLGDDSLMRLEYQEPHDSVREGYYRLKFSDDVTVFLSKSQVDDLIAVLKRG